MADGLQDQEPFILKDQHRCYRLVQTPDGSGISHAEIQNLSEWSTYNVKATTYIVCCNAYLTPQVLFNSGIRRFTSTGFSDSTTCVASASW